MSGFTDRMIDDGYTDPQEYMEYLEDEATKYYENQMNYEDYDNYYEPDDDCDEEY